MQSYDITDRKVFMAKLLKSDLFDTFEVREALIHTSFKMILDGKRNMDYFDTECEEKLSHYLSWHEIRQNVYELMQGHKLPSYFKIILSTSPEKTSTISPLVSAFFLNIQFKDNLVTCSTGCAYKEFTLDQSADKIWDERIKNFLFKYEFM